MEFCLFCPSVGSIKMFHEAASVARQKKTDVAFLACVLPVFGGSSYRKKKQHDTGGNLAATGHGRGRFR